MFQSATPAVTTRTVRSGRERASPFIDAASSMPPKNRMTPRTDVETAGTGSPPSR